LIFLSIAINVEEIEMKLRNLLIADFFPINTINSDFKHFKKTSVDCEAAYIYLIFFGFVFTLVAQRPRPRVHLRY